MSGTFCWWFSAGISGGCSDGVVGRFVDCLGGLYPFPIVGDGVVAICCSLWFRGYTTAVCWFLKLL